MTPDPYELLGVNKNATQDEIKRAYRAKARRFHPDVNPGDPEAEEMFKEISRAYDVLTNPDRRGNSRSAPNGPPGFFNFEDMMGQFFSFHFRPSNDIEISVPISLQHLLDGTSTTIRGQKRTRCNRCHGSGLNTTDCLVCGGSGKIDGEVCDACSGTRRSSSEHCVACNGGGLVGMIFEMDVQIPPGMNVSPLVLSGMGHGGLEQKPPGDMIVTPRVSVPIGCQIVGRTKLLWEVGIDPVLFLVGGEVEVETPLGDRVSIDVPETSGFGNTMNLIGMGLPMTFGNKEPRDHLVLRLVPKLPDSISEECRDLLNRYVEMTRLPDEIHDVGEMVNDDV